MIKVDECVINDWIYQIISLLEDKDRSKEELMKLSSYIVTAPRIDINSTNWPKPNLRSG